MMAPNKQFFSKIKTIGVNDKFNVSMVSYSTHALAKYWQKEVPAYLKTTVTKDINQNIIKGFGLDELLPFLQYQKYLQTYNLARPMISGRKRKAPGLDATRFYAKVVKYKSWLHFKPFSIQKKVKSSINDPAYVQSVLRTHVPTWKSNLDEHFFESITPMQEQVFCHCTLKKVSILDTQCP